MNTSLNLIWVWKLHSYLKSLRTKENKTTPAHLLRTELPHIENEQQGMQGCAWGCLSTWCFCLELASLASCQQLLPTTNDPERTHLSGVLKKGIVGRKVSGLFGLGVGFFFEWLFVFGFVRLVLFSFSQQLGFCSHGSENIWGNVIFDGLKGMKCLYLFKDIISLAICFEVWPVNS